MVSALVSRSLGPGSSLDMSVVLCSWAKHFILTVPLSTQVYEWVPANLMLGGNPVMDYYFTIWAIQGWGVGGILLVASCFRLLARMRTLSLSTKI